MAKVKQLWREMSPAEQANYGMSITKTIEDNAQIANDVDFDEPIENNAQIANDIDFDEPMYEPAPKTQHKEEPTVSYYIFLNKIFATVVAKKTI